MPPPPVASVAVRSKAVVLLRLIHCLFLFPLFVGPCFVVPYLVTIILMGKRDLFALLYAFLMAVAFNVRRLFLTVPRVWSTVCDCGISWLLLHSFRQAIAVLEAPSLFSDYRAWRLQNACSVHHSKLIFSKPFKILITLTNKSF